MELPPCRLDELPKYLKDSLNLSALGNADHDESQTISILDLQTIAELDSPSIQHIHLILRRHALTQIIALNGLYPPLIHERALVYEILGFADLAAADAFVTYVLCESVRSDEWISDLEPKELSGEPWNLDGDESENLALLCDALATLCRSCIHLGATEDADEKFEELVVQYGELIGWDSDKDDLARQTASFLNKNVIYQSQRISRYDTEQTLGHKFGWSRREIYPWNTYEPDRNIARSLSEINSMLSKVAPDLEVKVTALPALHEDGTLSTGVWHQLGLFAAKNFPPRTEILREKSLLTAIRPLHDALCDACGVDLESVSRESLRECEGFGCDVTFCSDDCATRAATEYHTPHIPTNTDDSEDDAVDQDGDYPGSSPSPARFCGNTELNEIGRISSTTTAEWDLYFLLMTRTIQISVTQRTHPLSLPSTKYLWGDFNPPSIFVVSNESQQSPPKRTLPWSLHHNLTLPLQYFETLMQTDRNLTPYSPRWLANHDWWIQTTLAAKFRGVANAQQSTFDGRPEIAAVHPLWCLANHSCAPNVAWSPTGERVFRVREAASENATETETEKWEGIKAGEEIWSHYTDVRLPVKERRERLMEVLGGVCRCPRCLKEAGEN